MSIRPCNPSANHVRHERNRLAIALTTLVFALGATAAHALSSDRDQPMDITANYQKTQLNTGNNQPGLTHLKGNVRMLQGSLKALADEATMYQHASNAKDAQGNDISGGVERIVLVGKRAHLEQMQDNNAGLMSADADKIDYNTDTGIAVLTGNVSILQHGRGEFHGAQMTYNTRSGEIESGDNSPSSRVHMIIQPKAKSTAPKPAAKPSAETKAEPAKTTPGNDGSP